MKTKNTSSIIPILAGRIVQRWTVVTLVQDRISCSVHASEYEAYCEAVSRFHFVELDLDHEDSVLNGILEGSSTNGEYQEVRKYIEEHACRMSLIQIAEHSVNDVYRSQLRIPSLAPATSRVPSGALA